MSDLQDRYDIAQVIIRYAASVDQRDLDRYGSCFTEDVTITGFSSGDVHGKRGSRDRSHKAGTCDGTPVQDGKGECGLPQPIESRDGRDA